MSRQRHLDTSQNPLHPPIVDAVDRTTTTPYSMFGADGQTVQDAQQSTLCCDILKTTAASASVGGAFLLGETLITHSTTMGMFEAGLTTGGVGYIGYKLGRWITSEPLSHEEDRQGHQLVGAFGWPVTIGFTGIATFATTLDPWMLSLVSCGVGCCIGASQNWCVTTPGNDGQPIVAPITANTIIVQQPTATLPSAPPSSTITTATIAAQHVGTGGQDNPLPKATIVR